jgi:hypothetical protein
MTVTMLGQTKSFPFAINGKRTAVAKVKVNWASRMVRAN